MEYSVHYIGLVDRNAKCHEQEALGRRMISDTFDEGRQSFNNPTGTMIFTDEPEPPQVPSAPPPSTHISQLVSLYIVAERPARVKRVWEGREYLVDCLVSMTVFNEFGEGRLVVGDYVLVHYDDMGEQIVMGKVFKSWP